MIPKKATISIRSAIDIDSILDSNEKEFLEREGFTDEEIHNYLEHIIRDTIWELVPENKINVSFD